MKVECLYGQDEIQKYVRTDDNVIKNDVKIFCIDDSVLSYINGGSSGTYANYSALKHRYQDIKDHIVKLKQCLTTDKYLKRIVDIEIVNCKMVLQDLNKILKGGSDDFILFPNKEMSLYTIDHEIGHVVCEGFCRYYDLLTHECLILRKDKCKWFIDCNQCFHAKEAYAWEYALLKADKRGEFNSFFEYTDTEMKLIGSYNRDYEVVIDYLFKKYKKKRIHKTKKGE